MSVRAYTLRDIAHLIAQRRWLVLIPFALGVAAAPILARYAPERYRSEALLLVIPQQVPTDYVTPTMTQRIDERLPAITDQILSRSRLEQIIQQLDLYTAERSSMVMEDVVQKMREDIRTSAAGREINSFRVGYVSDAPEKARKVTERLASLYIEQNLKDRENQADSTSQFLNTQLEEAKRRLVDQEKKLEAYRKSPRRAASFAATGELASESDRQPAIAVVERVHQPGAGAEAPHRAADRGCQDCPVACGSESGRGCAAGYRRSNSKSPVRVWRWRCSVTHPGTRKS